MSENRSDDKERHFVDPKAPAEGDQWPQTLTTACGVKMPADGPVEDIIPLWRSRDMLMPQIRQRLNRVSCEQCIGDETYQQLAVAFDLTDKMRARPEQQRNLAA